MGCCFKLGGRSDVSDPIEENVYLWFKLLEFDYIVCNWLVDFEDLAVFSLVLSRVLFFWESASIKGREFIWGIYLKGAFIDYIIRS